MESVTSLLKHALGERTYKKLELVYSPRELGAYGVSELMGTYGLTEKEAKRVNAVFELGRIAEEQRLTRGRKFLSSREIFRHFSPRMRDLKQEQFHAVYLDGKHRVMEMRMVSQGTLTTAPVHPRDIFGAALRMAAAAIVFVHNHPSGDPSPSADDLALTRRLEECGALFGIQVLDHVIIGDGEYVSLTDRGLIGSPVARY